MGQKWRSTIVYSKIEEAQYNIGGEHEKFWVYLMPELLTSLHKKRSEESASF
jgi:hypothetical protein